MSAILLIIPFLLIRFGFMCFVNTNTISRAALFAPVIGYERIAYYIYQITNIFIFIYPLFLQIKITLSWQSCLGLVCYGGGLILCARSIIDFSSSDHQGMNKNGIYRISRNPMYLSYFFCFIGFALLTQSFLLFIVVIIFQISSHWIILSEERWCLAKFGNEYKQYMQEVGR